MKVQWLWILSLISASGSIPTSPTHQRLGSDEIRITSGNRDVCLAKLLCGMSVVTLQDAYDSETKDGVIYGDYAQIVAKFFQENPADDFDDGDESLSQESVEAALEDYSVSTEDEDEEEVPLVQYRPKRPAIKKKFQKLKNRPAAPTTAAAPIQIKKVVTPKPTPPGIQIFDLGMPVQEITSKPKSPKALFSSLQHNTRMSKARKIMRRAGLATKLRTVRQCQRISGCTYTFKQLYQKYGGKGVIDELSQPMQPLHVVDEQWSRQPQDAGSKRPLENAWVSPPLNSSSPAPPTAADFEVEYGSLNTKVPAGLEPYFQASFNGAPTLTNPGTAYKIKKVQKQSAPLFLNIPHKKKHRKKPTTTSTTTTTERSTTTTATTTTTEPTTTTTTTTTTTPPSTTTPPRRLVHYKRPPSKKQRPSAEDDDEDDNINETSPVQLIGHHEHDFDDEAADRHQHQIEYEDENDDEESENESQDDYDEEEKYNVPVDYGNDDEESDEQDDSDTVPKRRPVPAPKPKPIVNEKKKERPSFDAAHIQTQSDTTDNSEQPHPISQPIPKYRPKQPARDQFTSDVPKHRPKQPARDKFTSEFESVQTGNLKKLKKKKKDDESRETSTEEIDDADDDLDDGNSDPPAFEYPTHIGGRPIFPDYDIPVAAYGVTRSNMPAANSRPPLQPSDPGPRPKNKKSKRKQSEHRYPFHYNYPPPGSSHDQASGAHNPGMGFEPTSGMSVLTPIKSLFKHLSSGISPNPVGGSMGYTNSQSPTSLHYQMPPGQALPPGFSGGSPPSGGPHGITVPLKSDDAQSPNVPQIAIMPQIPKGPESSEYKRPAKYTINRTKKIPSL